MKTKRIHPLLQVLALAVLVTAAFALEHTVPVPQDDGTAEVDGCCCDGETAGCVDDCDDCDCEEDCECDREGDCDCGDDCDCLTGSGGCGSHDVGEGEEEEPEPAPGHCGGCH